MTNYNKNYASSTKLRLIFVIDLYYLYDKFDGISNFVNSW